MPHETIEWWNFNIPHDEQTVECPDFLLNSSEKDKRLIGSWDADYECMPWLEVKELIASNRIDLFQRIPSELRRYRQYIYQTEKEHGSINNFIQHELLRWSDLTPQGSPFSCPDDVRVLRNDWPYGIDKHIVHLVVWTKFQLKEDALSGYLTDEARRLVQEFVDRTFKSRVPLEHVTWFKNWRSLKSVHAVEHFHIMLFNPDPAFVKEITAAHVPSIVTHERKSSAAQK